MMIRSVYIGLWWCLMAVAGFNTDLRQTANHSDLCFAVTTVPVTITAVTVPGSTQGGNLSIQFRHVAGDQALQLYTTRYTNRLGEPFTVNRFKYYLSHVSVIDANDQTHLLSDKTFLVDEADSMSKRLTFTTPAAVPQFLSFTIGVDSLLNVSGIQSGDLDPLKGMFWTWNSGYIFAKLEGKSDSSHAPAHSFTWDVGGYKAPYKAYRTITLPIPADFTADAGHPLVVTADILKWFDGLAPLVIAQQPQCHQPGKLAMQIADNYATMFSIAP